MRRKPIVLIICIITLATVIPITVLSDEIPVGETVHTGYIDDVDMLIFVSPQYSNDLDIYGAIDTYVNVVEDEIGWKLKVINLSVEENDFKKIDEIIEDHYNNHPVKACIMVGEDIDTALQCDQDWEDCPSTVPWYTLGGESNYQMVEDGMLGEPHKMDICISLLYPISDVNYNTKKSQIIRVFNKFSENRSIFYSGEILAFTDNSIVNMENRRQIYNSMKKYGNLYYKENPSMKEVNNSLDDSYSMYFIHGHSTCSYTFLHTLYNIFDVRFQAKFLDELKTPFFGAAGCYVHGWWTGKPDNNELDPSVTRKNVPGYDYSTYSSRIFISSFLRAMILGFPDQSGFTYPISFIENVLPNITKGKIIAEAMIGHRYYGDDATFVGDPTFRFTTDQNPPLTPSRPTGLTSGEENVEYSFETTSIDPDGNQLFYEWSWGDGTTSDWLGPYDSNETAEAFHRWNHGGTYEIKVKAKDVYDAESSWSPSLYLGIGPLMANANGPYIISVNYPLQLFGDAWGGTPFYKYTWDFGDGNISYQQNPTHLYRAVGNYSVRLTVVDSKNNSAENLTVTTVLKDFNEPSVKIVKPTRYVIYFDNKIILPSDKTLIFGDINIEIIAADESGIKNVELIIDQKEKYNFYDDPYVWCWDEPSFGKHTIKAVAYDNAGNSASDELVVWKFF